jgi:hypothetical protein
MFLQRTKVGVWSAKCSQIAMSTHATTMPDIIGHVNWPKAVLQLSKISCSFKGKEKVL